MSCTAKVFTEIATAIQAICANAAKSPKLTAMYHLLPLAHQ